MGLIVQKFGGSSVADADRIRNVARIITETYRRGHRVVAVLSAQGDTTDDLIAKAAEINPNASKREMDMLLSTGEQISCSLCAMAIEAMGYPVVSLTGWQAGFRTNSSYGDARIKRIDTERVLAELDKNTIVIVTGFQGLNKYEDITTLGRGGSDTSAVALAAVLHADLCQIYTDVDGVYTADPRHVKGARKLEEITYDEMLELATLGAQVLHNRSVEMAKRYGVNLEVLSSFSGKPGTKVKEVAKTMEKLHVSGVACIRFSFIMNIQFIVFCQYKNNVYSQVSGEAVFSIGREKGQFQCIFIQLFRLPYFGSKPRIPTVGTMCIRIRHQMISNRIQRKR